MLSDNSSPEQQISSSEETDFMEAFLGSMQSGHSSEEPVLPAEVEVEKPEVQEINDWVFDKSDAPTHKSDGATSSLTRPAASRPSILRPQHAPDGSVHASKDEIEINLEG